MKTKKRLRALTGAITDIVLAAVILLVFAYFHHGRMYLLGRGFVEAPAATAQPTAAAAAQPTPETEAPDEQVIRTERAKALHTAIAELPEEMRSAIVLRDIRGFAYEEIADMLNVNIGTVKSRISRGREKLREKIMTNAELFDKHGV